MSDALTDSNRAEREWDSAVKAEEDDPDFNKFMAAAVLAGLTTKIHIYDEARERVLQMIAEGKGKPGQKADLRLVANGLVKNLRAIADHLEKKL